MAKNDSDILSWMKLDKDFQSKYKIRALINQKASGRGLNGYEMFTIFFLMLCESIPHGGELRYSKDKPYDMIYLMRRWAHSAGCRLEFEVATTYDKSSKRNVVGVMNALEHKDVGLVDAAVMAVQKTGYLMYMMVDGLYRLLLELSGKDLAGPIGVAHMAGEVAQMGIVPLLNFTAFLSINLGLVNLFPIPALDGGHFITLCIEAVRGKPLSPKALYYMQSVGVGLLILLMLFATANDLMRVFTGG